MADLSNAQKAWELYIKTVPQGQVPNPYAFCIGYNIAEEKLGTVSNAAVVERLKKELETFKEVKHFAKTKTFFGYDIDDVIDSTNVLIAIFENLA
jgi:hypothetical protein